MILNSENITDSGVTNSPFDIYWHPVVNDLVGGWAVANTTLPYSSISFNPDYYIVADLCSSNDAVAIAAGLNVIGYRPVL